MKVKILSDLHMEFEFFEYQYNKEDLLILAGDIHTKNKHWELLKQIPKEVTVVFVLGNHELYYSSKEYCEEYFSELSNQYPNFHFLDNTWEVVDNIAIFGGMMCTDFSYKNTQGLGKTVAKSFVNDFQFSWSIEDHVQEFLLFENRLRCFLSATENTKRIVVSHFLPHPLAIHPQFENSLLNSYFCRDMTQYMGWPGLWVYGHTHTAADFMEGDTRVVCNPKGYPHEAAKFYNPQFIVEI